MFVYSYLKQVVLASNKIWNYLAKSSTDNCNNIFLKFLPFTVAKVGFILYLLANKMTMF